MFEDLPRHAEYVIFSYALVAVAIGGLVAWMAYERRTQTRMLNRMQQQLDQRTPDHSSTQEARHD